jgi:hypothetical protein
MPFVRMALVAPVAAVLCFAVSATAQDISAGRWIDLTHPFNVR